MIISIFPSTYSMHPKQLYIILILYFISNHMIIDCVQIRLDISAKNNGQVKAFRSEDKQTLLPYPLKIQPDRPIQYFIVSTLSD